MKPGKEHPAWLHRAMGGSVKNYDGGGKVAPKPRTDWQGDPDSGKPMKELSAAEDAEAVGKIKSGAAKSVVGAAMTGYGRGLGRIPGALVLGSGAKDTADALIQSTKARRLNDEADRAEGKKRGGKVKGT